MEDDGPQIAAVYDSSSEEGPPPVPQQGQKRTRKSAESRKKQPPLDDAVRIQSMLAKSSCCKRNCKEQFRGKHGQEQVLQFRKEWQALHKTDQDEVVAKFWRNDFFYLGDCHLFVVLLVAKQPHARRHV